MIVALPAGRSEPLGFIVDSVGEILSVGEPQSPTRAPHPWVDERLVAGTLEGVFRSRDSGLRWQRISPAGHEELRNFDSLAIDPRDPGIIYAGTSGILDDHPVEQVKPFEKALYPFLRDKYPDVPLTIERTREFDKNIEETLKKALAEFKAQFTRQ